MPLSLSNEEAASLDLIIQLAPVSPRAEIADRVHDALIERGFIRWVGGILIVTPKGIEALGRHRELPPPLPG